MAQLYAVSSGLVANDQSIGRFLAYHAAPPSATMPAPAAMIHTSTPKLLLDDAGVSSGCKSAAPSSAIPPTDGGGVGVGDALALKTATLEGEITASTSKSVPRMMAG